MFVSKARLKPKFLQGKALRGTSFCSASFGVWRKARVPLFMTTATPVAFDSLLCHGASLFLSVLFCLLHVVALVVVVVVVVVLVLVVVVVMAVVMVVMVVMVAMVVMVVMVVMAVVVVVMVYMVVMAVVVVAVCSGGVATSRASKSIK